MVRHNHLPYRPCVGAMVLNRAGLIFMGRRIAGPEQLDPVHSWQMPQGALTPEKIPMPRQCES